ncbi:MAG: signal recognition particle receptor subunit alpha, partial [Mycoplasmoidaceae bacterium]|nr:signal recognition particle receptor subunit alpha [Mycoplasmoidaceae bacterium]
MLKTKLSGIVLNHMKKKLINSTITEEDIAEVLKQIRIALLDADVSLIVAKNFIKNVKAKAVGQVLDKGEDPEQFMLRIIKSELIEILGKQQTPIETKSKPVKIIMVGLQGSGKTTTAAKLANFFKSKQSFKPLLVGLDVYRPGAIDQLKQLATEINVDFYDHGTQDPRKTAIEAIELASQNKNDLIVFDTAGRLQTDENLMTELVDLKSIIHPTETLLVVDAMVGQDMINVASEFNDKLHLSGIIITKLDSDAKAGVALSLTSLLNVPIKMTGVGEKIGSLDLFYPERMADRILGLGDIMTLAEKAVDVIDENRSKKTMMRMLSGKMDLEDLL